MLYVGVTSDLVRRVYEHKAKICEGYTSRYQVDRLLYYEVFEDINDAFYRETRLKGGPRWKKVRLIDEFNPEWADLYDSLAPAPFRIRPS